MAQKYGQTRVGPVQRKCKIADRSVDVVSPNDASACYSTHAMANRVKALETSLQALQRQAKDMVANSSTITAEVTSKAVAALNIKDEIFQDLIPIDVCIEHGSNGLFGSRHHHNKFNKDDPNDRRVEEDDIENVPSEVKDARMSLLNLNRDHSPMKSWIKDSFQHLSPDTNRSELSFDDFWHCLRLKSEFTR